MGKPSAPTPPDPAATAAAQTQSNVDTARLSNRLNRVDQYTPYGSVTWEEARNPSTGGGGAGAGQTISLPGGGSFTLPGASSGTTGGSTTDRWKQTVNLSDNQQRLLTGQERLGIDLNNLASNQIDKVSDILGTNFTPRRFNSNSVTGGKLDLSRFDPSKQGALDLSRFDPSKALGNYGQSIEDETYKLATDRLSKQFGREEQDLRSTLANQGITAGSEGFTGEMAGFREGQGNAYSDARLAARDAALRSRAQYADELGQGASLAYDQRTLRNDELGQGAKLNLTGRQQNLAEAEADYGRNYAADLAARQVPLNEITSIMAGTPLTGQDPGSIYTRGVSDTDVAGITQNGFNNQMGIYNQKMGASNALLGGLFGLGGAAMGTKGLF